MTLDLLKIQEMYSQANSTGTEESRTSLVSPSDYRTFQPSDSPLQSIVRELFDRAFSFMPQSMRGLLFKVPGMGGVEESINDPAKLHAIMSAAVQLLSYGLKEDHEYGFATNGCVCSSPYPAEGGEESSESLHSWFNGHGEEHTDGSPDAAVQEDVQHEGLASQDVDNRLEAEVQSGERDEWT